MNPRLRIFLFGALAAVLAIVMGVDIANEGLAISLLVLGVLLWATMEWVRGPLPEAWLLAGVIAGYILGNRGFAQFSLMRGLPLLPAETVLLITVPTLAVRMAFGRVHAFYRDGLNFALLAWMVIGAARLPVDMQRHGLFAARDFAMVYYALFFFIAQGCAGHAASVRMLTSVLTGTFVVLPVVAAVEQLSPTFFFTHFTFRGIPFVFHKSDLLAAYLGGGFFWLWTRWEKTRHRLWLVPAAINLLMLGATASARAAMLALGIVTGIWLLAAIFLPHQRSRWRIFPAEIFIVGTAVAAVIFVANFTNRDIRHTAVYSAYEHAVSIVDIQGTGTYENAESGDPGQNNRFRTTWWRTVIEDTARQNPIFGLGFGYDLAARFLVEYELLAADDFTTRSPHSMLVSVFGRMGIVGLIAWLAVAWNMWLLTWRCFRVGDFDALGLMSIAWVLGLSACVGVVLEGPMGAVVFWSVLGFANRNLVEVAADESIPVADLQPELPADEVAASP